MPHEPHGFLASMIATGHEPTLPPDLHLDTHPSPSIDGPDAYVEAIKQRLQLTHQQVTSPPIPPAANPYQIGSLIYALTTPPEHTNEYQVVYEDEDMERTIHIKHAKPVKFTAPDLPEPVAPPEAPRPPLGYLPAGFAHRPTKPRAPPENSSVAPAPLAAPAENAMPRPATAPANQQPESAPLCRRSPRLNPV